MASEYRGPVLADVQRHVHGTRDCVSGSVVELIRKDASPVQPTVSFYQAGETDVAIEGGSFGM